MAATTTSTSQRWLPRLFQRSSSTSQSSADIISTHTNDRQGDMEFFASLEENTTLAFFRREEILVGDYLGKGTFTAIGAVVGIDHSDEQPAKCSSSVASTSATVNTSFSSQNSKRQELQDSLFVNGQPRYAMKQLTPATLQQADAKTLARAARELVNDAKYLARLAGHPGIVTLRGLTLDAFGHNYLAHQFDDFFLLRDRVSPHTLHDKIYREWRTDVEPDEDLIPIKANYAFQIAKALRWCHQHGVLYRDLKPTNVGFSWADPHVVQLLEFGLARDIPTIDSAPYRMTLAGTRRYLAGEVLTSGEYTWKSDVYSWSMVYFEMCTETKPYHGLSAGEHQTYVCQHGDRPTLDDYYFPEALDNILTQSWHPHLHQRWSMDQVCEGMQSFLMQLDLSYYQPKEGDFLFDIDPTPIHVESWTEEFGMANCDNVSVDAYSVMDQSIRSFYVEEEVAPPLSSSVVVADHNSQEEDAVEPPKTSDNLTQGLEYVRRASLSSARRMSLSSARRASLSSVKTPEETTSVRRASLSSVQAVTPRRFIPSAA